MNPQIKEDKVLEFRALTMTRRVFEQIRVVTNPQAVKLIGWVNEPVEVFIGVLNNSLVRVRRMDEFDFVAGSIDVDKMQRELGELQVGAAEYVNRKVDELRDSLPQIFLK